MRNVRLIYTKTDRMKFVSHLDMNRFFIRLFRMASLPVWYTEGFNQHVYVTFALPLSLGFESNYEIVDFKITDDSYTDEMLLSALNKYAVPGIEFIEAFEPEQKAKFAVFSSYRIKVRKDANSDKLVEYLKRDSIIAKKKNKKGEINEIEIAGYISDMSVEEDGGSVFIEMTLPSGNELSINPTLYFESFKENTGIETEYSVLKTCVYNADKKIFR